MKYCCTVVGWVICLISSLQAQDFVWVHQLSSPGITWVQKSVVDRAGNVYNIGGFEDTIDIDSESGVQLLTSRAGRGAFIRKITNSGQLLWARVLENPGVVLHDLEINQHDELVFSGSYFDSIDINTDSGSSQWIYGDGGFIVKLDANGNFIWGMGENGLISIEIALDSFGGLYTGGNFSRVVDLDPGPTVLLDTAAFRDAVVRKFDQNQQLVWAKLFKGIGVSGISRLAIDSSLNVCIAGYFDDWIDLDPSSGFDQRVSLGGYDNFITKLDLQGNRLWGHTFGSNPSGSYVANVVTDMVIDADQSIYVLGTFDNAIDIDPSATVQTLSAVRSTDGYLQKLDAQGNLLWAKTVGGWGVVEPTAITLDEQRNIYTVGVFLDSVDLDSDAGRFMLAADRYHQCYAQCLNPQGSFLWGRRLGGYIPEDVCLDTARNIFIAGTFYGTTDFNPGPDTVLLNAPLPVNDRDGFLLKLNDCDTRYTTDTVNACSSYVGLNGISYTQSGIIVDTLVAWTGCDSIVRRQLNILQNTTIDTLYACQQYTWQNGTTYYSDTLMVDTLLNRYGCDSILEYQLFVGKPTVTIDTVIACETYQWQDSVTYLQDTLGVRRILTDRFGCDSIILLDLTILKSTSSIDSIFACAPFTWIDGVTYQTSTTSTYTLTNSAGCDSIITLQLTRLPNNAPPARDTIVACGPYTWRNGITYRSSTTATALIAGRTGCDTLYFLNLTIVSLDTMLTQNGNYLMVNDTGGMYQWIDCATNTAILGATGRQFTPNANGNYAVRITRNGCSTLTACIGFYRVGVDRLEPKGLTIYPNPTQALLTITVPVPYKTGQLYIINAKGQLCFSQQCRGETTVAVDTAPLERGTYFLYLDIGSTVYYEKFSKN